MSALATTGGLSSVPHSRVVWCALALVLGLVPLGGCTAIVGDGSARCVPPAPGEPEGCPDGTTCQAGVCLACVPTNDDCNGIDDDCDGMVDETHDVDGDGVTWCGGGIQDNADCNDSSSVAYPGAIERCDGIDNDCDDLIDEGASICPGAAMCINFQCAVPSCANGGVTCATDERCDLDTVPPSCVPGGCTPGSCPTGQVCDDVTGSCLVDGELGAPCSVDGQCADGVCMPGAALDLTVDRCSRACCSDDECPADMVCWGPGNGARACVPKSDVVGDTGAGTGADTCTADEECRSGICGDDVCIEPCASHDGCDEEDFRCRAAVVDAPMSGDAFLTLSCAEGNDGRQVGQSCAFFEPCDSDLCIFDSDNTRFVCIGGCGRRSDCPDQMHCDYAFTARDFGGVAGDVQVCLPTNHGGRDVTGDSCDDDDDCWDRGCIAGTCADTCCNDDDCTTDTRCRPTARGSRWEMRCIAGG